MQNAFLPWRIWLSYSKISVEGLVLARQGRLTLNILVLVWGILWRLDGWPSWAIMQSVDIVDPTRYQVWIRIPSYWYQVLHVPGTRYQNVRKCKISLDIDLNAQTYIMFPNRVVCTNCARILVRLSCRYASHPTVYYVQIVLRILARLSCRHASHPTVYK